MCTYVLFAHGRLVWCLFVFLARRIQGLPSDATGVRSRLSLNPSIPRILSLNKCSCEQILN